MKNASVIALILCVIFLLIPGCSRSLHDSPDATQTSNKTAPPPDADKTLNKMASYSDLIGHKVAIEYSSVVVGDRIVPIMQSGKVINIGPDFLLLKYKVDRLEKFYIYYCPISTIHTIEDKGID